LTGTSEPLYKGLGNVKNFGRVMKLASLRKIGQYTARFEHNISFLFIMDDFDVILAIPFS